MASKPTKIPLPVGTKVRVISKEEAYSMKSGSGINIFSKEEWFDASLPVEKRIVPTHHCMTSNMTKYCGKETTIKAVEYFPDTIHIYHLDWLEGVWEFWMFDVVEKMVCVCTKCDLHHHECICDGPAQKGYVTSSTYKELYER